MAPVRFCISLGKHLRAAVLKAAADSDRTIGQVIRQAIMKDLGLTQDDVKWVRPTARRSRPPVPVSKPPVPLPPIPLTVAEAITAGHWVIVPDDWLSQCRDFTADLETALNALQVNPLDPRDRWVAWDPRVTDGPEIVARDGQCVTYQGLTIQQINGNGIG